MQASHHGPHHLLPKVHHTYYPKYTKRHQRVSGRIVPHLLLPTQSTPSGTEYRTYSYLKHKHHHTIYLHHTSALSTQHLADKVNRNTEQAAAATPAAAAACCWRRLLLAWVRAWQLGLRRHPRPADDQVIQVVGVGGSRSGLHGLQAGCVQGSPGQGALVGRDQQKCEVWHHESVSIRCNAE